MLSEGWAANSCTVNMLLFVLVLSAYDTKVAPTNLTVNETHPPETRISASADHHPERYERQMSKRWRKTVKRGW